MQILIDNQDGLGSLDYTLCVQFGKGSTISRTLNRPSLCSLSIVIGDFGRPTPVRYARVRITDDTGSALFTGYVASSPAMNVSGRGDTGFVYVALVTVVSDELLLDTNVATSQTTLLGQSAAQDWSLLGALSSSSTLPISLSEQLTASSRVQVAKGARWSNIAGVLASSSRSAYRCIAGEVEVTQFGEVTHSVASGDPGLRFEQINVDDLRWLASDVMVIGREEPTAYIVEIFQGDGSTTGFELSQKPFAPVAQQRTKVADLFQGEKLNASLWAVQDSSSHVALTASGLTCNGGTGRDAEATVSSLQQIELGGVLTVEGGGVQITSGSTGIVLGLYTGAVTEANCFAGFGISSAAGVTTVTALVNGAVAGSTFEPEAGHLYTYRLRVYSPEMERVRQNYFSMASEEPSYMGGDVVISGGIVQLQIQDVTSGSPGAPTLLYCGAVSTVPASCFLGLLDSGNLMCSIRSVECTQTGPVWVRLAAPGAAPAAQFTGTQVDGATCKVTTGGKLNFYTGAVPSAGSLVFVNYRAGARAVARRALPAGSSGVPVTAMWIGTVTQPIAWSSVDCNNAAEAIVSTAASPAVAMKGTYTAYNLQQGTDVWPGDALLTGSIQGIVPVGLIVEEVEIELQGYAPETLLYRVRFANNSAESACIKLSSTIPEDIVLPQQPTSIGSALVSLSSLTVTSVSGTVTSVNTGMSAPVNGGFEVRRRDDTFGQGIDSDLVLRASTSSISIPRAAPVEQYYIRMYDGSVPPNYSLLSAAVFVNVPLS